MNCQNCSAYVPPGEYRCLECGAPVPQLEPEPEASGWVADVRAMLR